MNIERDKKIIQDMKDGLSVTELMEKYNLGRASIKRVCKGISRKQEDPPRKGWLRQYVE